MAWRFVHAMRVVRPAVGCSARGRLCGEVDADVSGKRPVGVSHKDFADVAHEHEGEHAVARGIPGGRGPCPSKLQCARRALWAARLPVLP